MMWAVGARYGYNTLTMKAHDIAFFFRGHQYMIDEELHGQSEVVRVLGGEKK